MIHKLAAGMASIFVSYGESSEENMDIYTYACEAIIATLFNVLVCMVIGVAFGRLSESITFMVVFVSLRRYVGGYHAKTHFRCILTFSIILIGSLVATTLIYQWRFNYLAISIFATVVVLGIYLIAFHRQSTATMEKNPSKELINKRGICLLVSFWTFCLGGYYVLGLAISPAIAFAMLAVLGSLLCANAHERYKKRECVLNEKYEGE